MGRRLAAFLNGMSTVFNIAPKASNWQSNYIKPVELESFSTLTNDKNRIAKNMQKVFTHDLGNALNKEKENLTTEEVKSFEKISKLHKQAEKYYEIKNSSHCTK